jgi:hypothetical protein
MNSAEVAQGGPEAVLLGSDKAPLVDDIAADHAGGGGHGRLRLRQQRLHQLRLLTRQVCRFLSNLRKVHENLSVYPRGGYGQLISRLCLLVIYRKHIINRRTVGCALRSFHKVVTDAHISYSAARIL